MKRCLRLLPALAAALVAACDSDATGPDLRLVGTWTAGPTPVSVSSGASVPGFYVYTLRFDETGGYHWEAAVYGSPEARRTDLLAVVQVSGEVAAEDGELRFHPTFSMARSVTGSTPEALFPVPVAGPRTDTGYLYAGDRLLVSLRNPHPHGKGRIVEFHRRKTRK